MHLVPRILVILILVIAPLGNLVERGLPQKGSGFWTLFIQSAVWVVLLWWGGFWTR